jgi:hypothetical protein
LIGILILNSGVQGLAGVNLSTAAVRDVMTEVSLSAAYDSIILGELPHMTRRQAENLLAENAMLGRLKPFRADAEVQARLTFLLLFAAEYNFLFAAEYNFHRMNIRSVFGLGLHMKHHLSPPRVEVTNLFQSRLE